MIQRKIKITLSGERRKNRRDYKTSSYISKENTEQRLSYYTDSQNNQFGV